MSNIVLSGLTFVGSGIVNGVALFVERSAGIVSGFRKLTSKVNYADKTNVHWKVELPTIVAADSPCGCAGEVSYINYIDVSARFDRRTTAAERTAVLDMIQDLVASSQFEASITSLVLTD